MSKSTSPKIDWLREESHIVHNPKLNYKENGASIFQDSAHICTTHPINLIIGSSMGGYLG